jgi:predicted secreted hydrolase
MLYRLRKKSGQGDPFTSGTYVDQLGNAHFLDNSQLFFSSGHNWKSPQSGTSYPISWQIRIPTLDLELSEQTALKDQELFSKTSVTAGYWEGAVTYKGQIHSRPVQGIGYLEMTGYGEPLTLGHE